MILDKFLSKSYAEIKLVLDDIEKKAEKTKPLKDHAEALMKKEKPKQLSLF